MLIAPYSTIILYRIKQDEHIYGQATHFLKWLML